MKFINRGKFRFIIFKEKTNMGDSTDNIRVCVRVRPLNTREDGQGAEFCVQFDEDNNNKIA